MSLNIIQVTMYFNSSTRVLFMVNYCADIKKTFVK